MMKTPYSGKYQVWIFGITMALLFFILRFIEFKYLIRDISLEILIGFLAFIFSVLGIYVGLNLHRPSKLEIGGQSMDQAKLLQNLPISRREAEILVLLEKGLSNQEIADKLFISLSTVKSHISRIFQKLEVKRRTQAVKKAKALLAGEN